MTDILSICVLNTPNDTQISKQVPTPAENYVFVVDTQAVHFKDLTCDESGVYDYHSSPSSLVKVDIQNGQIKNTKIISRTNITENDPRLQDENIYLIKRNYSKQVNTFGDATRIISKVYSKSGLHWYAITQYIGKRECRLKGHGNAKGNNTTLYLRTKPSVINHEKHLAKYETPKKVINIYDKTKSCNNKKVSDRPRDRQQIYNVKKNNNISFKARNKVSCPDFSKLVAAMDNGVFVKNINFDRRAKFQRIHPNTFAATDATLKWTQTYCSPNSEHKSQLGIDMTYKICLFILLF